MTPAEQRAKDHARIFEPGFNSRIKADAERRMALIDKLPPELRACVHDFGYPPVRELMNHGVKSARSIRHLIAFIRGYYADGRVAVVGNHSISGTRR